MNNPWKEIDLDSYEKHMSLDSVYQRQAMNEIMKEQFYAHDVKTLMILGIAGGNGLEHIKKDRIEKVFGVDINKDYLDECEKRYPELCGTLDTICADLMRENLHLPNSDLLIANLLIEYVGYECFKKVVALVNPKHVSCIIQINTEESFVSDSPYLHVFDRLDEVHHQMEKTALINSMQEIGYAKELVEEKNLPNRKKLVRIDFKKSLTEGHPMNLSEFESEFSKLDSNSKSRRLEKVK